ncbi:hypothetical protein J0H58_37090 [bacterium]|nr:hypothetical protein [bacterium]
MTIPLPGRTVVLGLVTLAVPAGAARANDFFRHFCSPKHGCTDTQRVVIPGQQVEVVREQPRVIVREVAPARELVSRTVHHRAAEVTPIGTVYMPLTLPAYPAFPAFPAMPVAPAAREVCAPASRDLEFESSPLDAAHRAEVAALRSERARRELEVTAEAHKRVLDRIGASDRGPASRAPDGGGSANHAAIEAKLAQLHGEMTRMNERLTAVERLLLYHDNYLTQHAGRGTTPTGPGLPPAATPPASTTPIGPGLPPAGEGARGPSPILNVPPPPGIGGTGTPPGIGGTGTPPMIPPR